MSLILAKKINIHLFMKFIYIHSLDICFATIVSFAQQCIFSKMLYFILTFKIQLQIIMKLIKNVHYSNYNTNIINYNALK